MLRTLARPMVAVVDRWMPGALVFAIALTGIVAVMALTLTDAGPTEVLRGWGDGLAGLLEFIAQISIVLLLGHTLAHTVPVKRGLERLARLPGSPVVAYGFVTLVAGLASLISWALGLIVGGIVALEVARSARSRGIRLHYPLLVACAYSGYVIWHMGYSASGPLAAATPGSFYEDLSRVVPISETVFAPFNLIAIVVTLIAVTAAMMLLAPKGDDVIVELVEADVPPDDAAPEPRPGADDRRSTSASATQTEAEASVAETAEPSPAERVDAARAVTLMLGVALTAYLVVYFAQEGFALTLDIVNWSFLAVILLVVQSPQRLGELVTDAGSAVGQVLLQYPLYAGILGMMTATGLVEVLSAFFVDLSTPRTLGLWSFLSGGLINMFIPSGGGQFAVQAPVFVDAARQLGVADAPIIMGIAYGDQWTNMIQPFWTIPLLAVAGLSVRDILGYTTITLLVSGVIFGVTLLIVGAG